MERDLEDLAGSDGISIHTGFPNPAAGALQSQKLALDLNQLVVSHASSTYLFRISGHEWEDQAMFDGDIAVVDRALNPDRSDLVVHWQDSSFTLCRYGELEQRLKPWGVVKAVIHQFR